MPTCSRLFAWLHKDALIAALDREIASEADDTAALSHEARQKAEADVLGDLLAVERDECALVWQAQAQGLPVEHRSDINPVALLGLRLVTAPRADVPETSRAVVEPRRRRAAVNRIARARASCRRRLARARERSVEQLLPRHLSRSAPGREPLCGETARRAGVLAGAGIPARLDDNAGGASMQGPRADAQRRPADASNAAARCPGPRQEWRDERALEGAGEMIRRRCTPEYAAWRAIIARGPVCTRWRSYPHFRRDTGAKPSWTHLLMRRDPSGAFEPSDAAWRVSPAYRRRRSTARSGA